MKAKICAVIAAVLAIITAFPQKIYAEDYKGERGVHTAYISGYPDGSVRPDAYVTREEAASVFYRLMDGEGKKINLAFKDVDPARWSYEAVSTLAGEDIIAGDDNGMFRPEDRITRAEMAVMAVKFAGSKKGGAALADIAGHWAEEYIISAVSAGWLAGYTDGEFKPENYITRAEMIFMINNVLNRRTENEDDLLNGMTVWTDNTDSSKWYYSAIQEASNSHEYVRKENGYEMWNIIIE